MIGKQIRLERIINRDTRRTVIVPMDHGTTVGPIPGLEDMRETVTHVVNGGANEILMHKGMVGAGHRGGGRDIGLIGQMFTLPAKDFKQVRVKGFDFFNIGCLRFGILVKRRPYQ